MKLDTYTSLGKIREVAIRGFLKAFWNRLKKGRGGGREEGFVYKTRRKCPKFWAKKDGD